MKKIVSMFLSIFFLIGVFTGCSSDFEIENPLQSEKSTQSQSESSAEKPNILNGLNYNGATINIQMSETEISSDNLMIGSESKQVIS